MSIFGKIRFWERSWAQVKARHAPEQSAVIVVGDDIGRDQVQFIERRLAFSVPATSSVVLKPSEDALQFMKDIVNAKAKFFIAIGVQLTATQKRALKYLDMAFAEIPSLDEQAVENTDAEIVSDHMRQLKERRNAIYMHAPKPSELGVLLRAYAESKRMFPDLVLLLTGVNETQLEGLEHGFLAVRTDVSKSKIQLCDIIYDDINERQSSWAMAANVCIISGRLNDLEAQMKSTLGLGAAVIVMGLPKQTSRAFTDLETMGAIWSVKRPQSLALTLSQALEPSQTALTVMQAMIYYYGQNSSFDNTIDNLLAKAS